VVKEITEHTIRAIAPAGRWRRGGLSPSGQVCSNGSPNARQLGKTSALQPAQVGLFGVSFILNTKRYHHVDCFSR
jgi:hypothetical protein